jgi:hypothetical protein
MQDNVITLSVDAANDGSPVNQDYSRHHETTDRTTYIGTTHTEAEREQFQLYRTAAKRSGVSRGSRKCAIKFTQDVSVLNADGSGDIVLPLIGEVSFAIPLGVTDAQLVELRQRLVSILDDDSIAGSLMSTLEI